MGTFSSVLQGVSAFFADLLNKCLKWFSYTKIWVWFAQNILGKFTFRWWGHPLFPMEKYWCILDAIQKDQAENGPGIYAFVALDKQSMSTKAIQTISRCYWTHAGYVIENGKRALHMQAPYLTYEHLLEVLRRTDDFAIGRIALHEGGYEAVSALQRYAKDHPQEFPYDFQQTLGGSSFYCSEKVYLDCANHSSDPRFTPHMEFGRPVFEPDDLYHAMQVIFEHRS